MILGIFDSWAQALEVIGVWIAAVATFAAVMVSLNIANKANRQIVKVFAKPMHAAEVRGGAPHSVFFVSATNLGDRPVTIKSLGWRAILGFCTFVIPSGEYGSGTMPVSLNHGEIEHWVFPESKPNGKSFYEDFARCFATKNWVVRWISLRTFRIYVVTSLDKLFFSKPSKEFRAKINQQMQIGQAK